MVARTVTGIVWCALHATVCMAQDSPARMDDLSAALSRTKPGTTLMVAASSSQYHGKFHALKDGQLLVGVHDAGQSHEVAIPADSVYAVWTSRAHGGRGALIGFAAGFLVGGALSLLGDLDAGDAMLVGIGSGVVLCLPGMLFGKTSKSLVQLYPATGGVR